MRAVVSAALDRLAQARDELRRLDADLGDGDLGITVSAGAGAVREALATLPDDASPAALLRAAAPPFASANPSTFAALIASGLLAAAKALADIRTVDRDAALALGRAAAQAIATRGKSARGEKTVLDSLLPSLEALEGAPPDRGQALDLMIRAAEHGVRETTPLRSQRGRAAWIQERSEGLADPGAVAYLRFLEALRAAWLDGQPAGTGGSLDLQDA